MRFADAAECQPPDESAVTTVTAGDIVAPAVEAPRSGWPQQSGPVARQQRRQILSVGELIEAIREERRIASQAIDSLLTLANIPPFRLRSEDPRATTPDEWYQLLTPRSLVRSTSASACATAMCTPCWCHSSGRSDRRPARYKQSHPRQNLRHPAQGSRSVPALRWIVSKRRHIPAP